MRSRFAAGACALALCAGVHAVPFTPANDNEVVERLPLASDPSARRVESLRRQLAARPDDTVLRVEVARRYFDLAMAQGDPRLVGYASAALAPLAKSVPDSAGYWMALGLIQQYSHDFDKALASLGNAAQLSPAWPEPLAWRSAILMVQARYPEALAECRKLAPLADTLLATGCGAYVRAATGELEAAYKELDQALKAAPIVPDGLALWVNTRLAEMALRLQRPEAAERHFKAALATGVTDQFLLGAYADFLLAARRPAEVISLLEGWERSDILLLRLALAGKAASHPRGAGWAAQLNERFTEASGRGDRLHDLEAARAALDLDNLPAKALKLAADNYDKQKEPRDAEMLMRAAVAAKKPQAALPAVAWLRANRYEDPALGRLAAELAALEGGR